MHGSTILSCGHRSHRNRSHDLFPLDLAAGDVAPVAMGAPAING